MFERVYLAADAKPNQERAHEIIRRIFAHLVDEGTLSAGRDRLRRLG
jgi:hypothetical protein